MVTTRARWGRGSVVPLPDLRGLSDLGGLCPVLQVRLTVSPFCGILRVQTGMSHTWAITGAIALTFIAARRGPGVGHAYPRRDLKDTNSANHEHPPGGLALSASEQPRRARSRQNSIAHQYKSNRTPVQTESHAVGMQSHTCTNQIARRRNSIAHPYESNRTPVQTESHAVGMQSHTCANQIARRRNSIAHLCKLNRTPVQIESPGVGTRLHGVSRKGGAEGAAPARHGFPAKQTGGNQHGKAHSSYHSLPTAH
jgi:hypothetical protein